MTGSRRELVFQDFAAFVYGSAPHCPSCTRVTDPAAAALPDDAPDPPFDVSLTFDGAVLASGSFRAACRGVAGARFSRVAGADDLWLLEVDPIVRLEPFDSNVRQGPSCDACGHVRWSTRSGPQVIDGDDGSAGLVRSDIEFGDTADFGADQPIRLRPALFVDGATASVLKGADLLGVHLIVQP